MMGYDKIAVDKIQNKIGSRHVGIYLYIFLAFALSGCATASKKETVLPQPLASQRTAAGYQKVEYSQQYEDKDVSYKKPVKKTSSKTLALLSPKQLQQALKNAGFYQGPVDGKIGSKTKEAIVSFQRSKGLTPDGVVGGKTSAALSSYL